MTQVYRGQTTHLIAEFFQYAGGPAADVTGLTIQITDPASGNVVGPTGTGIVHAATGVYTYKWAVSGGAPLGNYLVAWVANEGSTAETVTVTLVSSAVSGSRGRGIQRPTYATRRAVKASPDIRSTIFDDADVDSALERAADSIDGLCHRRFYNVLETMYWDWPNFQRAYPWRIWFDERELADTANTVPVVTTGGQTIPSSAIFWGPWNYSPPFTFMELDRSQSYSYGVGTTPQRDVAVTGLFGYWDRNQVAGTLAAAVTDTTGTSFTVSDSSQVDAGDVLTVDYETVLVQDTAMADTGQAQTGSGCTTASSADNQLTVSDGTQLHAGEVLQLDGERLLALAVTGNTVTVERAYDGTVLVDHGDAAVYALRLLTVSRGDFGSTAATHLVGASLTVAVVPGLIRELAIAEALNTVAQKTASYGRTIGENARPVPGGSLPDLRDDVQRAFGRKHRQGVI
jgi:hypothetical protein